MKFTHRPSVPHYEQGLEVIDFIASNHLDFFTGNVLKYLCRCHHKGDVVGDLKKAEQYLLLLIELEHKLNWFYRLCRLCLIRLNWFYFTRESVRTLSDSYQIGWRQSEVIRLIYASRFHLERDKVIELLWQSYRSLSDLIAYEETQNFHQ